MQNVFQWFLDMVYFEDDLLKTAVCILGFIFCVMLILDIFTIIKQGMFSSK